MLLWITVMQFSEFPAKELKTCTEKIKTKLYHHQGTLQSLGLLLKMEMWKSFLRNEVKGSEYLHIALKPPKHLVFDVYMHLLAILFPFMLWFGIHCQFLHNTIDNKIQVDPNYPTLQNNWNKNYRIANNSAKLEHLSKWLKVSLILIHSWKEVANWHKSKVVYGVTSWLQFRLGKIWKLKNSRNYKIILWHH